jgi:diketogulonate reductase-like aldo/keto reductase
MADTFRLNTDATIPAIGFGTWEVTPDSQAEVVVRSALEVGYRLIDTAKAYGNESGVGKAISESGIARENLFVTTKLWNDDQGYDETLEAFEGSLSRLGLEYLDLYLIHWPATPERHKSWRAFEELHESGRARAIGVSNYTVEHLQELMERSNIVPAVNQVEFHPFIYEQQKELLDFCKRHDIIVEAYSPLSRIAKESSAVISDIATRLNRPQQQIVLRWCFQHGTVSLPRSTSNDHLTSNFNIFDFQLSDADMDALNGISDGGRVTWDPAGMGN